MKNARQRHTHNPMRTLCIECKEREQDSGDGLCFACRAEIGITTHALVSDVELALNKYTASRWALADVSKLRTALLLTDQAGRLWRLEVSRIR